MKIKNKKTIKKEKTIIELHTNPVRDYLKDNPTNKLSIHALKSILSMKKRQIYFYCENSNQIRKVNPIEVGSYKDKLNVFEYNI